MPRPWAMPVCASPSRGAQPAPPLEDLEEELDLRRSSLSRCFCSSRASLRRSSPPRCFYSSRACTTLGSLGCRLLLPLERRVQDLASRWCPESLLRVPGWGEGGECAAGSGELEMGDNDADAARDFFYGEPFEKPLELGLFWTTKIVGPTTPTTLFYDAEMEATGDSLTPVLFVVSSHEPKNSLGSLVAPATE
jgi:hypothetical protein